MNQLQNLLHDALIATNHVQSCAIIKRKDAVLRASSVGFTVSIPNSGMRTIYKIIYIFGIMSFLVSCFIYLFLTPPPLVVASLRTDPPGAGCFVYLFLTPPLVATLRTDTPSAGCFVYLFLTPHFVVATLRTDPPSPGCFVYICF